MKKKAVVMAKSKKKTKVKPKAKANVKTKAKPKKVIKVKAKAKPKLKAKIKTPKSKPKAQAKPAPQQKINIDYSKAITPLADRLVVRLVQGERVTAGGLIIPDSVNTATGYLKGFVLAIGSGTKNKKGFVRPMDVKTGDTVLFSEYSGIKVKFNSEDLQIIKETDVMGIVQP